MIFCGVEGNTKISLCDVSIDRLRDEIARVVCKKCEYWTSRENPAFTGRWEFGIDRSWEDWLCYSYKILRLMLQL